MKLLITLETSENDQAVIPAVRELARASSAEVVLLNVVNPLTDAGAIVAETRQEAIREVVAERQAYLEELSGQFGSGAKIRIEQLEHGEDVPDGIARVSREEGADILVIATNRAAGIRGLILGSVAQHLLRLSPCPILIVRVD